MLANLSASADAVDGALSQSASRAAAGQRSADPTSPEGKKVAEAGFRGKAGPIPHKAKMERSFGTACHGAGRTMSRTAAAKHARGRRIDQELANRGVIARARSWKGLAEEQPAAYKDVDDVVEVVHAANLAAKVARMRPIGVIKG